MNQFARPGLGVTELPSFNENDKGKVLTINSESGVLGWEEGSGGSSGGGVLVVNATASDDALTLDKTWQEIYDADAVSIVWVEEDGFKHYMTCTKVVAQQPFGGGDTVYYVHTTTGGDAYSFKTNSASGYPSYTFE